MTLSGGLKLSIRTVHVIFITCSVLLSAFFAFWAYSVGQLPMCVAAAIVALGLAVYGAIFIQKTKGLVPHAILAFCLAMGTPAEACSVCYSAVDHPLTRGLNMGIFSLLIILLFIFTAFIKFFLDIRKRERDLLTHK